MVKAIKNSVMNLKVKNDAQTMKIQFRVIAKPYDASIFGPILKSVFDKISAVLSESLQLLYLVQG